MSKPTTMLLLDAGNTHIHLNVSNGTSLLLATPVEIKLSDVLGNPQQTLLPDEVTQLIGHAPCEFAVLGSVVPSANMRISDWIRSHLGIDTHIIGFTSQGMVKINYPAPSTIGTDRLANAVACVSENRYPAVVIDFGTATTFDVIDDSGAYCGGIIAPGISLMTDYLHEKTELLPKIQLQECSGAIGKSTIEAMQIGAVSGYRGLIKEILNGIIHSLNPTELHVIATGGCAELIMPGSFRDDSRFQGTPAIHFRSDRNLTLTGLQSLAVHFK